MGLRSWMGRERLSIESHRSLEIAFHLVFIGPLEKHPSLALVFFTSLSLYQKILFIHVGLLKPAISVVLSRSLPSTYNTEYASGLSPCGLVQ